MKKISVPLDKDKSFFIDRRYHALNRTYGNLPSIEEDLNPQKFSSM